MLPEGWESPQHSVKDTSEHLSCRLLSLSLTLFSVNHLCIISFRPRFVKASLLNKAHAKVFYWSANLCRKVRCFLWILFSPLIPFSNIFNWRQSKGKSQLLRIHQAPECLSILLNFYLVYHYLLLISLVSILLSSKTNSKCRLAKIPHQNVMYNQAHVQHIGRNVPSWITINLLMQFS